MKTIVFFILLIHGGIHLLGFLKAFGWAETAQLTAEISKPMGIIWLLVTLLFLMSGILLLWQVDWWFFPVIIAILLSSFLMISFWADSRYGMVPNLIILAIVAVSYGSWHMDKMIQRETNQLFTTMDFSNTLFPLFGIVTVLNIPCLTDKATDYNALRKNVRKALTAGVAGFLVPAGLFHIHIFHSTP